MKTKLLSLLFAIIASLGTIYAYSIDVDGIWYDDFNNTDMTVFVSYHHSGYNNGTYDHNLSDYAGNVTIPATIIYGGQTYSVIGIGTSAFENCTNLKSVTIPNGVTQIYNKAFAGCTNLTSVVIPNSMTNIWNAAFYGCSSMTSVTIPDGITSIMGGVFGGCSSLTEIIIPNGVTSIGANAFEGCSSLTSITIPENVTSIDGMIFNGCTSLTSVVWNAKNCADFGSQDNTLLRYYYYDSKNYKVYEKDISSQITSFVFGDDVEHIPAYLCSRLGNLTTITIPRSVTSIGAGAFSGCGITSVTIPSSVTSIGSEAFKSCNKLNLVYCELGAPVSIGENTFPNTATIYIPNCAFSAFSVAPVWKDLTLAPVSVNLSVVNNIGGVVVETCGSMEIEAIPYIGYHFKRWQDGNKDNPRKYTLSQTNRNFIAEFEIDKYQITLSCDANQGSITGDKGKFNFDTEHTIEAVPNYGYHFTQWSDGETENPRTFVLEQDTTFTALFAPNKYSLAIQYDDTFGEVEGDEGEFDYLSEHTITVTPKYGYHLASWSDGVTANPRTLVLTKDTTITATFAPNKYQLELIADANLGSIEGEQGEFDYLSEHEITAVPKTGCLFTAWSDGVTDNPRTIVLTQDTSITALFEQYVHEVTVTCNTEQGTVEKSSETYHSAECTIMATPNYGYHFVQWNDGVTENPRTFVVTQDTTFTAEFAVDRTGTCGTDLALTWTYEPEEKVLTISGTGAFNDNMQCGVEARTAVQKVVFSDGVTSVGASAFANCATLQTLILSKDVKKINENAFYNCENLTTIYNYRPTPTNALSSAFEGVDKYECVLYVPQASLDLYKNAAVWKDFYYIYSIAETPTGVENIHGDKVQCTKILRNGQILILRGEKTYTITGQAVK